MVLLCFDISPDCWRIITINTVEDWSDRICSNWMYFCQYHLTTYKVLYFVHWILVRKFSAGSRRVTGSRSVWLTGPRASRWWMPIFCWRLFTHWSARQANTLWLTNQSLSQRSNTSECHSKYFRQGRTESLSAPWQSDVCSGSSLFHHISWEGRTMSLILTLPAYC